MDLFDLMAKIRLDTSEYDKNADEAEKKAGRLGDAIKNGLKTAAKIGGMALGAAATGIGAMLKSSIEAYAEYEQLEGGVKTLFKTSSDQVIEYANNAYKTAGMSANEYMSTVTSFSASLLQSLDSDTAAAAEYANMAITDMSDNANKMGTSMELIQNAYQGFSKQNYTMLDNLKLGYGGTKEEMARLLKDAGKLAGKKFDLSNYADIVEAIHEIQVNMDITGTTALEASDTIQGSFSTMKGAWSNLLAGLTDPNQDLGALIQNVIDSAITVVQNIVPRIKEFAPKISDALFKMADALIPQLPALVESLLPSLVSGATALINALIKALPTIVSALSASVPMIVESLLTMLPLLLDSGLAILLALADGIIDSLPTLVPVAISTILTLIDRLTDPETLGSLIDAAIAIIIALADGIIDSLPELIEKAPEIIQNIVDGLVENLPKLLDAAFDIVVQLADGIIDSLPELGKACWQIISSLYNGIKDLFVNIFNVGKDVVLRLWEGIKAKGSWIYDKVKGFFKGLFGIGDDENSDFDGGEDEKLSTLVNTTAQNTAASLDMTPASKPSGSGGGGSFGGGDIVIYSTFELDGRTVAENQERVKSNKGLNLATGGATG